MVKIIKLIKSDSLRFYIIVLITAVAAGIGFCFKSAADPGTESKQFAGHTPLDLNFYVSNPDITLKVQLFIYQRKHSDLEYVFVQAEIPNNETGYILTLSSMPDTAGQLHRLTPAPDSGISTHIGRPYDSYYANVFKYSNSIETEIENNFSVEVFDFRTSKVIENTNASSYGHLPSVNSLYTALPYQDIEPCILSNLNASGKLSHVYIDPYGASCFYGTKGAFYPTKVSTAEILSGMGQKFKTEEVNYINPPGNIDGDSYTWEGSSALEPIFKLTDQDAVQAESDNAFMAGIAFGVAGGRQLP